MKTGIPSIIMSSFVVTSIIVSTSKRSWKTTVQAFQQSSVSSFCCPYSMISPYNSNIPATPSSTSVRSSFLARSESRIPTSSTVGHPTQPVAASRQVALFSTRAVAASSSRPEKIVTNASKDTTATTTTIVTTSTDKISSNNKTNRKPKKATATGGLRRLPVVRAPNEQMDRARKVPLRVKDDMTIQNVRVRARKHGAESLTALSQALCLPLRDVVDGYKREWRRLHPFERVVADLTVRSRQKKDGLTLQALLEEIHEARKTLLEVGKEWVHKAKYAESAKDATEATRAGTDRMIELYRELAYEPMAGMVDLQRSLRSAPAVQLDTPAVVLVGAPNVGKSSIVRHISSASPEVNNYPFTTRGMTLGHVEVFWTDQDTVARAVIPNNDVGNGGKKRRLKELSPDVLTGTYAFSQLCQVMDSPGILVRPEGEERNEMEELTLAAMKHLPTAVMYVMDLSGQAGDKCSSVKDQLQLRREIRARFPRRPWIDVISKIDLGIENEDETMAELDTILDGAPYIRLSIKEGEGIDQLRKEVMRMLGEVRVVLDAMAAVDEQHITRA